jgi:hypothetical protein
MGILACIVTVWARRLKLQLPVICNRVWAAGQWLELVCFLLTIVLTCCITGSVCMIKLIKSNNQFNELNIQV